MLVHFQNNLKKNRKKRKGKAANSMFAVRFAHPYAFGTSQSPRTLYEVVER